MNLATIAALGAATGTAAGITYGAVWPHSQIFAPSISRTNSPRKLAITFDDGPNPSLTPKLLDLLARNNARATFFVIGRYARQCPDLLRETAARGHVIANHTDTHPNLFWMGPTAIYDEFARCSDAITSVTGAPPKWFRPPFGLRNPWVGSALRKFRLRSVMFTSLPGDWRAPDHLCLVRRMNPIAKRAWALPQTTARTGDILCLHDGSHAQQNANREATYSALVYWLPRWRDAGLEFVTMDEAVDVPA